MSQLMNDFESRVYWDQLAKLVKGVQVREYAEVNTDGSRRGIVQFKWRDCGYTHGSIDSNLTAVF